MKTVAIMVLLLGISGASFANEIPVIGTDEQGQEVVKYFPRNRYARNLAYVIQATQDEALPALNKAKPGKRWKIRTLALGIGVDIKLGLTPFFELGFAPRFRAILTNNKDNPVIP
jgi:hypothetical protein